MKNDMGRSMALEKTTRYFAFFGLICQQNRLALEEVRVYNENQCGRMKEIKR